MRRDDPESLFRSKVDALRRRHTPKPPGPGLGDVVAGAAKAVGIRQKPGCGCARRQAAMNRATPSWLRRLLGRLVQP